MLAGCSPHPCPYVLAVSFNQAPHAPGSFDVHRYMVILRMGGVYADIDVELRQPLDSVVKPTDTMVVGWEAEVPDDAAAFKRHFVRKRQVRNSNWLGMGARRL